MAAVPAQGRSLAPLGRFFDEPGFARDRLRVGRLRLNKKQVPHWRFAPIRNNLIDFAVE
jgi:hypothetical protein